jgi:hypothetical protein
MLKSQPTNLFITTYRLLFTTKMGQLKKLICSIIIMVIIAPRASALDGMIRSLSRILYLLTKDYSTS